MRNNPDGTQSAVRTDTGGPATLSGGAVTVYDYEMPLAQSVTYTSLETPANETTPDTVTASQIWLIHPGIPVLSQPLDLLPGSLMEEAYPVRQAVFWPMGRSTPVVIGDGARKAASSTIVTLTETAPELEAMRALLADGSVLQLNIPPGLGLEFDTCYISVQDVKVSRLTDAAANVMRAFTLPFTVVGRPAGGSQSARTFADLLVYPNLAALKNAYADFAALLAGP
jgi:hypothetical protein